MEGSSDLPYDEIDTYKLIKQIGSGGMGAVYLAEQAYPFKKTVAIKLVKVDPLETIRQRQQFVARFEAERQALAMMDHASIARVFGGGTTRDGYPYLAMEFIDGKSLTSYCDDNNLSIRQRLELFLQICSAVQHAHQKGIIHRDLSPGNILVTEIDGKPVPKVIDFGLSKALDKDAKLAGQSLLTLHGSAHGKWEYMSPEQAEGKGLEIDTRTDVFALGAILYELLTGSPPIQWEEVKKKAHYQLVKMVVKRILLSQVSGFVTLRGVSRPSVNVEARVLIVLPRR